MKFKLYESYIPLLSLQTVYSARFTKTFSTRKTNNTTNDRCKTNTMHQSLVMLLALLVLNAFAKGLSKSGL